MMNQQKELNLITFSLNCLIERTMIAKKTSLMELAKDSMTRIKKHCSDFDPLPHLKMMKSMLKLEHIQRQFKN